MLTTTYSPAEPVGVRETLSSLRRGSQDPTHRTDASAVWRTMNTPLGSATLHIREGRHVQATAWGDGAEWAIASVPELLGSSDDWSGLRLDTHPQLAEVRRRHPGTRLAKTKLVFEALVPAILEQKVTGVEARSSWRYLLARYGEAAPGPAPIGMRVFPTPEVWRRIPSWEWHRAGVGPQRAQVICRAAERAIAIDRECGADETARRLRSLPGVGIWTASETVQRSHGDPDSVSVGDYHLAHRVGFVLTGRRTDDDGMLQLLEPWRGHRQRIVRLIELGGAPAPRFGARMTIQDHRWH